MKSYTYILLLFTSLFSSCYGIEKPEKPDHFLSESEMTNVLLDLSIMSAAKGIDKRKLEDLNILPQDYIFKKHQIDSTIFAENNNYYSYQLDTYKRIYQKVTDSLTALKSIAQNKSFIKIDKESDIKRANLKALKNDLPNEKVEKIEK